MPATRFPDTLRVFLFCLLFIIFTPRSSLAIPLPPVLASLWNLLPWVHPDTLAAPLHNAHSHPTSADSSGLPSYVIGAGNSSRSARFPPDPSRQMMHLPELALLTSYMRPTDVLLEFGTGGSTLNLAPLVARSYAIEHNCQWAQFVARQTRTAADPQIYANLRIRCVDIRPGFRRWGTRSQYEHADYRQFREYVDVIESLPDQTFDKVLIDGRARMACALKVLPYLHDDSVVFVHDFYARTSHYAGLLSYYDEVGRVLATRNTDPQLGPIDEPQGLVVLRRRTNLTRTHLSPSEINDKYDAVDWRIPFGQPLDTLWAWLQELMTWTDLSRWKRARHEVALAAMARQDLTWTFVVIALVVLWRDIYCDNTETSATARTTRGMAAGLTAFMRAVGVWRRRWGFAGEVKAGAIA